MNTIIENIALTLAFIIGAGGLAAGMAMIGIWRMEDERDIIQGKTYSSFEGK